MKVLTHAYIDLATQEIRELAKTDVEAAHSREDSLRHNFILWICDREGLPRDVREKARAVLATDDIDFPRHCA